MSKASASKRFSPNCASNSRAARSFTLLELMIVLLIIGLIGALVMPNLIKKADKAKYDSAKIQVKLLSNLVKDYYLDMNEYPRNLEDLVKDPGSDKWAGPYIDPPKVPLDPWGEEYRYQAPGQHGPFDLYSYGADKAAGGDKYNADIGNWE